MLFMYRGNKVYWKACKYVVLMTNVQYPFVYWEYLVPVLSKLRRLRGQILWHTYTFVTLLLFCVDKTHGRSFLFVPQFSCCRLYPPQFLTTCFQLWHLDWKDPGSVSFSWWHSSLLIHTLWNVQIIWLFVFSSCGAVMNYAFIGTQVEKNAKP